MSSVVSAGDIDFFVIGDSQVSYYHYQGYKNFIDNLYANCKDLPEFARLNQSRFTFKGHGVSGSNFGHWNDRRAPDQRNQHGDVCLDSEHTRSFQDGMGGNDYDNGNLRRYLCTQGRSGVEQAITNFNPSVVVANFLGNHGGDDYQTIKRDVDQFTASLPPGKACVVITSPPMMNIGTLPADLRRDIQDNARAEDAEKWLKEHPRWIRFRIQKAEEIHRAVRANGRCELVEGTNDRMQSRFGNDHRNYIRYYHNNAKLNRITASFDYYHVNDEGSLRFFKMKRQEICRAFTRALARSRRNSRSRNGETMVETFPDPNEVKPESERSAL